MVEYFRKYAADVLDNGYELVAIRPGTKRPFGDEWQKEVITKTKIDRYAKFGVGIKARKTPAVDIDIHDADLVEHMKQFTFDLCGVTLERVGLPPKTLLPYRSDEPFRKVNSKVFIDEAGNRNKLEVLGLGQQYVVFAIHPDTKKPYRWDEAQAPHIVPRANLPEITQEQARAIADEFERCAAERGWKQAVASNSLAKRGAGDPDDVFANDKPLVDISTDELTNLLMRVPGCEEYDRWRDIGMALYHQFEGAEEGLILWHQWSAQAGNYDSDVLDEKWPTFNDDGKGLEPITAKVIIKWAAAEEKRLATEAFQEYRGRLLAATKFEEFEEVCGEIKKLVFSVVLREQLVSVVKARLKDFGNSSPSIGLARSMVRYESREMTVAPPWMKPFAYVMEEDKFYSTRSRSSLTHKAFDSAFDRYMLTPGDRLEGKSTPEQHASDVALNRVQIPAVARKLYWPGNDLFFKFNGQHVVNTYSEDTIPETAGKLNAIEREVTSRIVRHFEHLFPIERDRELLISWMAFIVQNVGQRCNWAPLLQGVDGDGKTTIGEWLAAALGPENAEMIMGTQLEEKYTPWAEGSQFVFVEEVRLHGENRFDVVNKMKPYITNAVVAIRRMQRDVYSIPNMTSYMLTSNLKDALPAGLNDNRYYPMFSRWQFKEDIDKFKRDNPNYYDELRSILNHPGVIRKFFLEYELHDEFSPSKRAPESAAKFEMRAIERDDEDDALTDLLREGIHNCGETLLDTELFSEKIVEHGGSAPYGAAFKRFMHKHGFSYLDRVWIDGKPRRFYSRVPGMFHDKTGKTDAQKVRDYLADDDPL